MANYQSLARQAARRYGVPENIFLNMIRQESGFNPRARSSAGALGIAQFMPATARGMGVDPMNPRSALFGAARMLSNSQKQYGSWERALSAYNSGRPDAYKDPHFAGGQTYNYVKSIMGAAGPGVSGGHGAGIPGLGASVPGTTSIGEVPSDAPSYTKQDALQEGLQALASGHYNPTAGLASLLKAVKSASSAAVKMNGDAFNQGFNSIPIAAQASTPQAHKAAELVQHYLGVNYVWGGASPKGFDCSGLLQWVWSHVGVSIPRTSQEQWRAGRPVGKGQLRAGDAVFFEGRPGGPGHVGMYVGNGMFVESPHTGAVVRISKLRGRTDYVGGRRFT